MSETSGFIWTDIEDPHGDYMLPKVLSVPKKVDNEKTRAAMASLTDQLDSALNGLLKFPIQKTEVIHDTDGLCLLLTNFNEESMKVFLEKGCNQTVLDTVMTSVVKNIAEFLKSIGSAVLTRKLKDSGIEQRKSAPMEVWGTDILPVVTGLLDYLVNSDGYLSDLEGGMEKVIQYGPYNKAKFVRAECSTCGSEAVGGVWFGKPEDQDGTATGVFEIDLGTGNLITGDTRITGGIRRVIRNINEIPGLLEIFSRMSQIDEEEMLTTTVCKNCGTCVAKFITEDGVEILGTDRKAMLHLILNGYIEWGTEGLIKYSQVPVNQEVK